MSRPCYLCLFVRPSVRHKSEFYQRANHEGQTPHNSSFLGEIAIELPRGSPNTGGIKIESMIFDEYLAVFYKRYETLSYLIELAANATMVHGRGCNPHRCTTTFANLEITSL